MYTELSHYVLILTIFFVLTLKHTVRSRVISILFLILSICLCGTLACYMYSDFSIYNIFTNSNINTPLFYKISATWSNHEGSFLLWCWLLSLYGFIFCYFAEQSIMVLTHRKNASDHFMSFFRFYGSVTNPLSASSFVTPVVQTRIEERNASSPFPKGVSQRGDGCLRDCAASFRREQSLRRDTSRFDGGPKGYLQPLGSFGWPEVRRCAAQGILLKEDRPAGKNRKQGPLGRSEGRFVRTALKNPLGQTHEKDNKMSLTPFRSVQLMALAHKVQVYSSTTTKFLWDTPKGALKWLVIPKGYSSLRRNPRGCCPPSGGQSKQLWAAPSSFRNTADTLKGQTGVVQSTRSECITNSPIFGWRSSFQIIKGSNVYMYQRRAAAMYFDPRWHVTSRLFSERHNLNFLRNWSPTLYSKGMYYTAWAKKFPKRPPVKQLRLWILLRLNQKAKWTEVQQRINSFLIYMYIICIFTLFLILTSNPFLRMPFTCLNSVVELNPVLQDPVLAVHPPCIYAGYVASAVGFSLCLSKLWQISTEYRNTISASTRKQHSRWSLLRDPFRQGVLRNTSTLIDGSLNKTSQEITEKNGAILFLRTVGFIPRDPSSFRRIVTQQERFFTPPLGEFFRSESLRSECVTNSPIFGQRSSFLCESTVHSSQGRSVERQWRDSFLPEVPVAKSFESNTKRELILLDRLVPSGTKQDAAQIRTWSLIGWCFLTVGILLGSWWAYHELGWGGWWFWDPVENASLMPWLCATAAIHSVISPKLIVVTLGLNLLTFILSLLGTFFVRSGLLASVHSFAVDSTRGLFLISFVLCVTVISVFLLVQFYKALQNTDLRSLGDQRETQERYEGPRGFGPTKTPANTKKPNVREPRVEVSHRTPRRNGTDHRRLLRNWSPNVSAQHRQASQGLQVSLRTPGETDTPKGLHSQSETNSSHISLGRHQHPPKGGVSLRTRYIRFFESEAKQRRNAVLGESGLRSSLMRILLRDRGLESSFISPPKVSTANRRKRPLRAFPLGEWTQTEQILLLQALCLILICAVVLCGTSAPVLFQWLFNRDVSTGGLFFNRILVPLFGGILAILVYMHYTQLKFKTVIAPLSTNANHTIPKGPPEGTFDHSFAKNAKSEAQKLPRVVENVFRPQRYIVNSKRLLACIWLLCLSHFIGLVWLLDLSLLETFYAVTCMCFFGCLMLAPKSKRFSLRVNHVILHQNTPPIPSRLIAFTNYWNKKAFNMKLSHAGLALFLIGVLLSNTYKIQLTQILRLGSQISLGTQICCLRGIDQNYGPTFHSICGNLVVYQQASTETTVVERLLSFFLGKDAFRRGSSFQEDTSTLKVRSTDSFPYGTHSLQHSHPFLRYTASAFPKNLSHEVLGKSDQSLGRVRYEISLGGHWFYGINDGVFYHKREAPRGDHREMDITQHWEITQSLKTFQRVLCLFPEKRFFFSNPELSTTKVAIHTNLFTDLYCLIGAGSAETGWYTTIMRLPFIFCIWIGFLLAAIGGVYSLSYQVQKVKLKWS